jgi:hypothetical protein
MSYADMTIYIYIYIYIYINMCVFRHKDKTRRVSIAAARRGGRFLVRTKQTQKVEHSFRSPITRTRARHGGGSITLHVHRERAIIHT